MRDHILLFVNGQQYCVRGAEAFNTLSDFLRRRLKLCGTKIVCSEGDCGSCTVLCGRFPDTGTSSQLNYMPINACIRFVFQLDGCHIVTVEGICGPCNLDGKLNAVQESMVDCHGSQCGFCTPGFVVAMTGILEEVSQPTVEDWRHGLTGNLCRCTGYSPIIAAGLQSSSSEFPRMNECYPASTLFEKLEAVGRDEILIDVQSNERLNQTVFCPTSVESAVSFLAKNAEARIVAGATDLGVQFNKGSCPSRIWLDLNRVSELQGIAVEGNAVLAGARSTWTEFEQLTRQLAPQFHQIVSVFGSPQIRNVGTIGGNIVNASPIADALPFLFVCEAEIELASPSGRRTVNINDFYLGYKKMDLEPGELMTKLRIPLPPKHADVRLYKVSRRRDLDIATFTGGIWIEREGDTITHAAIAYGAVGPVVIRLRKTEAFLLGRPLNLETMELAGEIVVQEISPISDVRGGEQFRFQIAKNVLIKFFYETRPKAARA